jgi:hypothetical protein
MSAVDIAKNDAGRRRDAGTEIGPCGVVAHQNNSLAQKSKFGPNHVVAVLFCYTAVTDAAGNKG